MDCVVKIIFPFVVYIISPDIALPEVNVNKFSNVAVLFGFNVILTITLELFDDNN